MNRSRLVKSENITDRRSHLVKAIEVGLNNLKSYEDIPNGMFGSKAVIKSGNVTLKSDEIDFEFTVPFDDNLEAKEVDITVYNLSSNTINNLKRNAAITIEAGYKGDTGVIFSGFIDNVKTGYEDVDKVTTITCWDCVGTETITNVTYKENTKASTILKDLISKLKIPIAVFNMRRDWTYTSSVTVDGCLREEIKKYAEVCGVSVYTNKGRIYARYIKDGDNINFTVNEDTGLIGSPEYYTEEINAEDYVDAIDGYKVKMLLQHRITTAAIINLSSRETKGAFRVRKGEHNYSDGEATTSFEAIGNITSYKEEKEKNNKTAKTTEDKAKKVISTGKKYKGTPYKEGGNTSKGLDCSHFVVKAFTESGVQSKVTGYATAQELYNMSTKVATKNRQKGDIIFFNNGTKGNHIGIYTSGNKMLHCYKGGGVKETDISYGGHLVGYGRLW